MSLVNIKDLLLAKEDDVIEVEKDILIFDVNKACEVIFNVSDVGLVLMECINKETMHLGNSLSVYCLSSSHYVEPITNCI